MQLLGSFQKSSSENELHKTTHSPQNPISSPPRAPVVLYRHAGITLLSQISHAEMHNAHIQNIIPVNCTRVILFRSGDSIPFIRIGRNCICFPEPLPPSFQPPPTALNTFKTEFSAPPAANVRSPLQKLASFRKAG